MKRLFLLASTLLGACSAQPATDNAGTAGNLVTQDIPERPGDSAPVESPPAAPPPPTPPGNQAGGREVVSEAPIDPKSGQGAGQVVQTYFALVEAKKFAEAKRLWGPDAARAQDLSAYREHHAEVMKPGLVEGAAGSSYVTVPVRAYGVTAKGEKFEEPQVVTLRRVNDIDGSTAEQRRWHIVKIDRPPNEN